MQLHPILTSWFCEKISPKSPVTTGAQAGVRRIVPNRTGTSMFVRERNILLMDLPQFSGIFDNIR
jgi:hypothetical protein